MAGFVFMLCGLVESLGSLGGERAISCGVCRVLDLHVVLDAGVGWATVEVVYARLPDLLLLSYYS